jgi:primosomal protein N'
MSGVRESHERRIPSTTQKQENRMIIQTILNQNRRDFTAIFRCEHCNKTEEKRGYDDAYFHQNVVPSMTCVACGLSADSDSFRPLSTKYPEGQIV